MKSNLKFGVVVANDYHNPLPTYDFPSRRGEEKNSKPTHVCLPSMSLRVSTTASRERLRALRAAEMEAWTRSGGDFLRSRPATLRDNQNVAFLQSPPNALVYS
jgi:hypothetical protein